MIAARPNKVIDTPRAVGAERVRSARARATLDRIENRPESDVSIAILDAAEPAFAEYGYHGASLRFIAREAGVNQAMIAYYFKSKHGLLNAVIKRRADQINRERGAGLDRLLQAGKPTLEEVIEAFLRPAMELASDERLGGFAYVKLLAVLGNSLDDVSQHVIVENFDGIAQRYIDVIISTEPRLGNSAAVRGYLLTIAVGMSAVGIEWRVRRLAGEAYDRPETAELIRGAVAFAVAGISSLAQKS